MLYAGIGYYLDYYWNIKELNVPDQTISVFSNMVSIVMRLHPDLIFNPFMIREIIRSILPKGRMHPSGIDLM